MRWKATNLLSDSPLEPVIRQGDALRLSASPSDAVSGTAEIRINGKNIGVCAVGEAVVHRFEEPGVHTLEGAFDGLDEHGNPVVRMGTMTVRAVEVEPVVLAAQVNHPREWQRPPEWPEEAVVEWDFRLQRPLVDGNPGLRTNLPENRHGVVRLGVAGPALAPVTVKGFNLWVMRDTDLYYETIHPDGSFRAETTIVMSPVHPEVRVHQRSRGPVAYLDGSRVRDFTAADFDRLGEIGVIFAHSSPFAHSVCHYTDSYQDDTHLGRAY